MTSTLELDVGLLIRRPLRQMLERLKFGGVAIEWLEHRDWTGSVFTIKAPLSILKAIEKALDE